MKILKSVFLMFLLCAAAFAQEQAAQAPATEDLGLNVFSNVKKPILMVVDAGLAVRKLDGPYVMFMAYMAAKNGDQNIVVRRQDVVMVYKDVEYKMPTVKELTGNYNGQVNDFDLYQELNKNALILSRMKFYRFLGDNDFYPTPGLSQEIAADEGSLYGFNGLKTKLYFKNPGFKKGDSIVIKVRDKKNPEVTGEVVVEFK